MFSQVFLHRYLRMESANEEFACDPDSQVKLGKSQRKPVSSVKVSFLNSGMGYAPKIELKFSILHLVALWYIKAIVVALVTYVALLKVSVVFQTPIKAL